MALVVQKYGGSSVADADGIKRVAQRIVATRKAGDQVVVVVSAMGDTTDELIDLASQVSPLPPAPRARHAADRGRADLDGAAGHGDRQPRPGGALVHRVPGRRDHRRARTAGRGSSTSRRAGSPARWPTARSRSWPGSRACRRTARTSPRWAGAARTPPRSRWPRRWSADVCEIYTDVDGVFTADPRIVRTARRIPRISYEEMLEMAACGAKVLLLRCVEYARRYDMPIHVRSSFSNRDGTWVSGHANDERRKPGWSRRSSPGSRTTGARRRSPWSGVPDRVGEAARIFRAIAEAGINIDMIVQNVSAAATGRTDISFTLPRDDGQAAMAALRALQRDDRLRVAALRRPDRQGVADRRGHAVPPGRQRHVLRRAGRGGREHRDDLHLGDQDLGGGGPERRGPGGDRRRTRRSTWTRTRSRPSCTGGPAGERGPRRAARAGRGRRHRRGRHGHARPAVHPRRRLGRDPAGRLAAFGGAPADRARPRDRGRRAGPGRVRRHRRRHVRRARRGLGAVGAVPRPSAARWPWTTPARSGWTPTSRWSCPRSTRSSWPPAQGDHRQPELHHAVADRGRGRAAPGVRARGDGGRLLPGRLRRGPGRHRHALRAAGQGRGHAVARAAGRRRPVRGRRPGAVPRAAGA